MNFQFLAIGAVIIFLSGLGAGWKYEHGRFMDFKEAVAVEAAKQEAHVESITKQQALVTKGIQDEHNAKLTTLRNYYKSTSMWNNTSSGQVPGLSTAPGSADVIAAYNLLAGQCAETTLTLVDLQKWLNEQIGIK
jgi:hypothetical protein